VVAKFGDSMADKSDAYIDGRFGALAETQPSDPIKDAIKNPAPKVDAVSDARAAYLKDHLKIGVAA